MVCPVDDATTVIGFVTTVNRQAVAGLQRHPVGEVDIVCNQQGSSIGHSQDEALMPGAFVIIRQRTFDSSRYRDPFAC